MSDSNNLMLSTIAKSQKRANYIQILRNMYDAGMIDNETYRTELKSIAELEGFSTNKKFWIRPLI